MSGHYYIQNGWPLIKKKITLYSHAQTYSENKHLQTLNLADFDDMS